MVAFGDVVEFFLQFGRDLRILVDEVVGFRRILPEMKEMVGLFERLATGLLATTRTAGWDEFQGAAPDGKSLRRSG